MLVFDGPILHQMVTPKACQSFLRSQTFFGFKHFLAQKKKTNAGALPLTQIIIVKHRN